MDPTSTNEPGSDRGDRTGVQDLLDRLRIEHDERAVVSVAMVNAGGRWQLVAGSVLFGPVQMGDLSWTDWHAEQTGQRSPTAVYGIRPGQWSTFTFDHGDWRLRRFTLSAVDAAAALTEWLRTSIMIGGAGAGEHIHARLSPPHAPRLALSRSTGGTMGALIALAERPVYGWMHTIEPQPTAVQHKAQENLSANLPTMPEDWVLEPGAPVCEAAPLWLLGFSVGAHRPAGLLVGRVGRDGWLCDFRGAPPALEDVTVTIGIDPERLSLWDLVVDLEETDLDGNLLAARRIRLADLDLPAHGEARYRLTLPSLGQRLRRRLRLFGLDGRLLDGADDVHLLEAIDFTLANLDDGRELSNTRAGDNTPPPTNDRMAALDRAEDLYAHLLTGGLAGRLVLDTGTGSTQLRDRLRAARTELLIIDRYFGQQDSLWEALDDVTVPIRILTAAGGARYSQPKTAAPNAPSLQVRRVPPRQIHDRTYTWGGGGLSIGASINGLDKGAMYLIDSLEPHVADGISALFNRWWVQATATWPGRTRG